ncbi:hypothetical protein NQ318_019112 [Aromia moschata]|uniref:Reverse transcriptase domain-containing protein n=1 Tax=Aromia moschata TaxID=1265417 RepID=A0AAV8XR56_9CUCU|nr:hypothetical protein NQ318_019112 [Aromia moschata]
MAELAKKQQRLKTLIAKKQQYFSRFQRMYDSSKRTEEPAQLDYFRIRYETLEESKTAFLEVIDQIQAVEYEINSDYVPCFQSLDAFDELYCHIKIAARRILKNDDSTNMSVNRGIPKLPKLQIPNFSGNIKDWPTYIECFNSLIHHNGNLSDVDRVHYLIGSLSGAALSVCSGVPPTGENYRIIYQTLVDKYSDKRATANYYLDQIINFRQAQTETATSLNAFLEKFDVAVKSLQKLQISELDDYILAYLALSKLNPETQRLFENAHRKTEMPSYTDIVTFVKEQAKICIRSPNKKLNSSLDSKNDKPKQTHSFLVQNNLSRQNKCYVCKNNDHPITECSKFLGMCPLDRYTFIRNNNFCLNCLGSHKVINCQRLVNCVIIHCYILRNLVKLLIKTENDIAGVDSIARASGYNSSNIPGDSQEMNPSNEVASTSNVQSVANYCSVNAKSHNEDSNKMVLLSTVKVNIPDISGKLYIARCLLDSCSQANFLTFDRFLEVQGIGSLCSKIYGCSKIMIVSRIDPSKKYSVEVLVVDKITSRLPQVEIDFKTLSHLTDVPLADDTFYKPNQIDGIIGAELYPYLIGQGRVTGASEAPVAIETSLGYVVMGSVHMTESPSTSLSFCSIVDPSLDNLVKRFWETEDVSSSSVANPDDVACEAIFEKTFSRDKSGRYTVTLPFQYDPTNLGDSYKMAERRFLALEKKLLTNQNFREQYIEIIRDYLRQGHMTKLHQTDCPSPVYYIPHHAIYKPDSSSTPIRIVFDASAKTDSSYSLNDLLYTGPKLQTDVVTMFLHFRLFSIAFIADLRQMYRQILVNKKFRCFQRILWRTHPNEPLATYELNTVSFGIKSSPFLALRTVRQLANDEQSSLGLAAEVVKHHMYMDDLITSSATVDQAIILYKELVELFHRGGFELVKWATNSEKLLEQIPQQYRSSSTVSFDIHFLKVLGLQWQPKDDILSFSLDITEKRCSKRNILSTVARCFDPLGFLSPVTLKAKLLIKQMWILKLDWDESPPDDIVQWWNEFQTSLPLLTNFSIPRHVGAFDNCIASLIGFADACKTSYGAVVYVRIKSPTGVSTSLLYAKTKVSPLKVLSIPRLELLACHLGLSPSSFIQNHLWLSGPLWLKDDFSCWPINPVKEYFTKLEEKPISMVTLTKEVHAFYLLADRCSSWLKLLHSVVYVLRFLKLLPKHSMFLADDLLKAEMFVLKAIQNVHFSSEIKMLKTSGNPCSSSLKPLRPFLHEGLLRVVTYILDHISFCHYFVRSIGFYPLAML